MMGCVPSAVAAKNKSKVSLAPSHNTLRGDLISRDEARQRRNQGLAQHQAKANKVAQTIAYSTMAEKEMMSTASTERSYRSGRAFLINAAAGGAVADSNGSEQGSSSTVSDGANQVRWEQQGAPARSKNDSLIPPSTTLPYAVPEEELPHQQPDPSDVKGQEVKLQNGGVKSQRTSREEESPVEVRKTSVDRTREPKNKTESDSNLRMDVNIDEDEVKGQEAALDSQASQISGNEEIEGKKPARTVQFAEDGPEDMMEFEGRKFDKDERTKPTENGSVACLPAG